MATTFRVVPDETKYMVGHRVVNVKVNNLVKKRVILHTAESRFFEPS